MILQSKAQRDIGDNVESYKDESGLHFIKFDFVMGGPEIKQIVKEHLPVVLAVISYFLWRFFLDISG